MTSNNGDVATGLNAGLTQQDDNVIAVMGATGAGKSNFIRAITGLEEIVVGHGLESCTQKLATYRFSLGDMKITFVDTPGFNDTYRSDTEVLEEIARWLETTYRANCKLTGLIYLHRITEIRMQGSSLRNLRMFRKLCGEHTMQNIVLATTHWDQVEHDVGVARETELRETESFWRTMISLGAQVARFNGDPECGRAIVQLLTGKPRIDLKIQQELVDEGKPLPTTEAGTTVNDELLRLRQKLEEEKKNLEAVLVATREAAERAALQKEEELKELLRQTQERTRLEELAKKIDQEQRRITKSVVNELKRFRKRF